MNVSAQAYGSLECPIAGIYSLEGNFRHLSRLVSLDSEDFTTCVGTTTLTSGCSAVDKMELHQDCSTDRRYQCKLDFSLINTFFFLNSNYHVLSSVTHT